MSAPDLSVVIPCYNEAEHLAASAAALLEVLDRTSYDWEVVFVDDVSSDDTRAILAEVCRRSPRCRWLGHERNRGRGGAFKTGFAASTGRITGFIDVDLEVHAHYIPALVNLIDRHGWDVATGHRHYLLRQTGALHRHVLSTAYRLLCRALLTSGVRDSETGCKFFRRETAAQVVLGATCDGWFWDTEVMTRAALAGLRIHELPVLFVRRRDKRSTVRLVPDVWHYLVELHRFRRRAGLSLADRSPLYWSGRGYDLAMRALYGAGYRRTYAEVAHRIPEGASVVDVCCGTAALHRLALDGRAASYLGLDANGHFVMSVRRRGIPARLFDLRTEAVSPADYVVMCNSFYHFRRTADAVLAKLRTAAGRAVIISEPVRNLSADLPRPLGSLLARLTNPGVGDYGERFDLPAFRAFAETHRASEFAHRPGERNAIAVFPPA